jgi:hypothetical protein
LCTFIWVYTQDNKRRERENKNKFVRVLSTTSSENYAKQAKNCTKKKKRKTKPHEAAATAMIIND